MQNVLGYIESGKQEAKLISGGSRVRLDGSKGFFLEPTIFGGVTNEMKIAQEEIFGPVLSVLAFDDIEQVIEKANANPYGLAAAVWTKDIKKAHRFPAAFRRAPCGSTPTDLWTPPCRSAASKSGFGRELGSHAVEHYTELKTVWLNMA